MLEKALERERQQYIEFGKQQCKQQYIEEGEAKKQKEIVLNLLAAKVDINIIVRTTGLSVNEIMKLSNENNTHH